MYSERCMLCSQAKAGVQIQCDNIWSLNVTPHRPAESTLQCDSFVTTQVQTTKAGHLSSPFPPSYMGAHIKITEIFRRHYTHFNSCIKFTF